ncbi:uncharacterized protein LOC135829841 [Sycon ciliatum]|uniref:uncharacterized protein LOC135829841 n=1 Tax=Sycon ciliatum TaxID=27933 RepID=UPI0031F6490B
MASAQDESPSVKFAEPLPAFRAPSPESTSAADIEEANGQGQRSSDKDLIRRRRSDAKARSRPKSMHARQENGTGQEGIGAEDSARTKRHQPVAVEDEHRTSLQQPGPPKQRKQGERRAKSAGPSPFNTEARSLVSIQTNFIVENLMKAPVERTDDAGRGRKKSSLTPALPVSSQSSYLSKATTPRTPPAYDACSESSSRVLSRATSSTHSSDVSSESRQISLDGEDADDDVSEESSSAIKHWKHAQKWLHRLQKESAEKSRTRAAFAAAMKLQQKRRQMKNSTEIVERYHELSEVRRITRDLSRDRKTQLSELLENGGIRMPGRALEQDGTEISHDTLTLPSSAAGEALPVPDAARSGTEAATAVASDASAAAETSIPKPPPVPDELITLHANHAPCQPRLRARRRRSRHRRQRKELKRSLSHEGAEPLDGTVKQRHREKTTASAPMLEGSAEVKRTTRRRRRRQQQRRSLERAASDEDPYQPLAEALPTDQSRRARASRRVRHSEGGGARHGLKEQLDMVQHQASSKQGRTAFGVKEPEDIRSGMNVLCPVPQGLSVRAADAPRYSLPADSGIAGDVLSLGADSQADAGAAGDTTPCVESPPHTLGEQLSNMSVQTLTSLDSSSTSCFTAASTKSLSSAAGSGDESQSLESSTSSSVFAQLSSYTSVPVTPLAEQQEERGMLFQRRPSDLPTGVLIIPARDDGLIPDDGSSLYPAVPFAPPPPPPHPAVASHALSVEPVGAAAKLSARLGERFRILSTESESQSSDFDFDDIEDGEVYDSDGALLHKPENTEAAVAKAKTPPVRRGSFFQRLEGMVKTRKITVEKTSFQLSGGLELDEDYKGREDAFDEFRENLGDDGFANAADVGKEGEEDYRLPMISKEEIVLMRIIEIAEEIEDEYGEMFDHAIADVTNKNLTFSSFSDTARSFLGVDRLSPKNIWAVLGFSRRVVQELPSTAEIVSDYTTRLLEEEALDYVNDRGGWGTMLKEPEAVVNENDSDDYPSGGLAVGMAVADGISSIARLFSPSPNRKASPKGVGRGPRSSVDAFQFPQLPPSTAASAREADTALEKVLDRHREESAREMVDNGDDDENDGAVEILADSEVFEQNASSSEAAAPAEGVSEPREPDLRSRLIGFGSTSTANVDTGSAMPGFGHEVTRIDADAITSEEWNGLLEHVRSNLGASDEIDDGQRRYRRHRSRLQRYNFVIDGPGVVDDGESTCASDSCVDTDSSVIADSMEIYPKKPEDEISVRRVKPPTLMKETSNNDSVDDSVEEPTSLLTRITTMGMVTAGAAVLAGLSFFKQQT